MKTTLKSFVGPDWQSNPTHRYSSRRSIYQTIPSTLLEEMEASILLLVVGKSKLSDDLELNLNGLLEARGLVNGVNSANSFETRFGDFSCTSFTYTCALI